MQPQHSRAPGIPAPVQLRQPQQCDQPPPPDGHAGLLAQ
eukprot:CAMPEP_0115077316 /NCGR_PEP_ID=MMETSP0227-20121206/16925_1 /TAXON_ID=89957 /ORGANISM="Polarella glacialis, Strain CCMP 1383" /LENGTH=38 /DNA_ID= /DNA_START= /DNA_END= /DNA_ORIENTATION=